MDDPHDHYQHIALKSYLSIAMLLALGYGMLWLTYPIVAAAVTAVLFILVTGLFTSKIFLNLQNPKLVWGLCPVFGSAWLLVFWIMWKLQSLLR